MITCAFVPLMPNDDTAARRTRSPVSHATGAVSSSSEPPDQSMCGDGASTCNVRGSTPARNAITILITPPMPAAAWACPMFDLSEPSRSGTSRSWPVHREQGLGLDRVAEHGAGAVRLDRVHIGRTQAGVPERGPDHAFLRRPVRRGQAVRRAVLVDRGSTQHGQHLVAVAPSVRQPLQQHQAGTLRPRGAVRAGRERLAAPVPRQPALPGELDEHAGRRHHRDTTGQRETALALPQRLHRQVHRDQRRRARRVDGDRRALKPEHVSDAAGRHTRRVAGQQIALGTVRVLVQPRPVVLRHRADEHTDLLAAQRRRVESRAFERLPGVLQQQSLLRVHRQRLARIDPEEHRVEPVGVVQEATPRGRRPRPQRLQVPAAVDRELGDRVDSVGHETPQVLRRRDVTGEPAAHRHDRDGLVRVGHHRGGLPRRRRGSRALELGRAGTRPAVPASGG